MRWLQCKQFNNSFDKWAVLKIMLKSCDTGWPLVTSNHTIMDVDGHGINGSTTYNSPIYAIFIHIQPYPSTPVIHTINTYICIYTYTIYIYLLYIYTILLWYYYIFPVFPIVTVQPQVFYTSAEAEKDLICCHPYWLSSGSILETMLALGVQPILKQWNINGILIV